MTVTAEEHDPPAHGAGPRWARPARARGRAARDRARAARLGTARRRHDLADDETPGQHGPAGHLRPAARLLDPRLVRVRGPAPAVAAVAGQRVLPRGRLVRVHRQPLRLLPAGAGRRGAGGGGGPVQPRLRAGAGAGVRRRVRVGPPARRAVARRGRGRRGVRLCAVAPRAGRAPACPVHRRDRAGLGGAGPWPRVLVRATDTGRSGSAPAGRRSAGPRRAGS